MNAEFVFYVYDDDADDPRFSFWMEFGDSGMSLYERPPDGAGMWLDPEPGSDHDAVAPSDDLRDAVAELLDDGIDAEVVETLPAHERYFLQVIHGTNVENPGGIPGPVWHWMERCAAERDPA